MYATFTQTGIAERSNLLVWQQAPLSSGWSVINLPVLLALKSPIALHRCNLCWTNKISQPIINFLAAYYHNTPFFMYSKRHTVNYMRHFSTVSRQIEMLHDNNNIGSFSLPAKLRITINPPLATWAKVLATAIERNFVELLSFIRVLLIQRNCILLLLSLGNIPIATSMLYITNNTALLQFIAVIREYRRQGFAKIITAKTIELSKKHGIDKLVIYSPQELSPMYTRIGFHYGSSLYIWRSK